MHKIIICQGIPASGKTFWSKHFVEENPNWIRINRDDIRKMFGKMWFPERESLVEDTEYSIAKIAAEHGWNIVIDDTNLNKKYIHHWIEFSNNFDYEIEFKKFDITLEDAIKRDSNRDCSVGESVIRRFYNKYYGDI